MKNIAAIALFLAATFIMAGSASAQANVKATVPFDFVVGDRTMPAGTYTIEPKTFSSHVLILSNPEREVHATIAGQPNQDNPKHVSKLEFRRYGNQYFLSDIRCEDGSMNIHFTASKSEESARAQIQEAQQRVDDPVTIALK